ncbi:hypothetical protein BDZ45DRAFT_681620 [Acephala macrosclerotiorum]|nr:hypothetical protein BDZ45DRAFT_681620 [Acephala macrosclerotiorum]
MSSNRYITNPAIELCVQQIEDGSAEKYVQVTWENLLWTVFPASDQWLNQTKHADTIGEPDNKVMKIVQFMGGWAPVDVLVVELKRHSENVSRNAFNRHADNLLDDFMEQSSNADGTILFGAIGIGKNVQFYKKQLPRGRLEGLHPHPITLSRMPTTSKLYLITSS